MNNEQTIRILKRYSANYQVIELEMETTKENREQALAYFDQLAETELKKMIEVSNKLTPAPTQQPQKNYNNYNKGGNNYNKGNSYSSNKPNTNTNPITPAQKNLINKNFANATVVAQRLGIPLANDIDVNNLTVAQASTIISETINLSNQQRSGGNQQPSQQAVGQNIPEDQLPF